MNENENVTEEVTNVVENQDASAPKKEEVRNLDNTAQNIPPLVDNTVSQPVQPVSSAPKKKSPVLLIVIILAVVLLIAVIGIVIVIKSNSAPKEKVYLTDNEISLLYGSPDNYKNKYVKLTGQVLAVKYDKKSQTISAYTDIENYTNIVVIYFEDKSVSIKENDYISFDGYIKGLDKDTSKPYIIAEKVEVISYMDAAAPTTKEVNVDKTVSQNDVTITIKKVEFSDVETRIYVKATNNTNTEFSLYSYSTLLTQAGKQYETTYSKNAVDMSSTILAGGNTEGVIVFPKIEQSNFTITMKGYSNNYDLDFENFVFDISVN